ncbi:helix-turn-helix domain-containing protein [Actinocatenispora sera]|uniref:PucR C-terminal helix-turn-helix domain-containing protein n=1 Tax=Actinocatenispora sera TaxID=390989 RepID=A0A810LAI2_9ACTN|nr:helix-turn-helix domain-containing protein [Actinocatenispora sera]BCJ32283.1 hypothetical protein Asera_63910 [Actinocatenispora sera]
MSARQAAGDRHTGPAEVAATVRPGDEGAVGNDAGPELSSELRALAAEAAAVDGVARILGRLSRRLDGTALLWDPTGGPSSARPQLPPGILAKVDAVSSGRLGALSVSADGRELSALPVTGRRPHPVLVVQRSAHRRPFTAAERALMSAATVPLGLALRERVVRDRAARLDRVEARNREAVLYLLQAGATSGACRAAAALGLRLSETIRVHLLECAGRSVAEAVRWCNDVAAGSGWATRCPAYRRQIVVVAQPDADDLVRALRERAGADASFHVGTSHAVPVTDFATAYRHAFHALCVARHRPGRYAEFRSRGELADILADAGGAWATRTLAPLRAHRPARSHDPDAAELIDTLTSWLVLRSRAARQLGLHRNTLASRLRLIESILGVTLSDITVQARLHLAIQMQGPSGDPEVSLVELLTRPEAQHWAAEQRAMLRGSDPRLAHTVRTWLRHGALITSTAAALGVSPSGVRKRLVRVEQLLQRAVLDAPTAQYDLCLALLCAPDPGPPAAAASARAERPLQLGATRIGPADPASSGCSARPSSTPRPRVSHASGSAPTRS